MYTALSAFMTEGVNDDYGVNDSFMHLFIRGNNAFIVCIHVYKHVFCFINMLFC